MITDRRNYDAEMDDLELNPRILAACKKVNFASFSTILSLSSADLGRRTKLPANDVRTLLHTVSEKVYTNPSATALELYHGTCHQSLRVSCLRTGCEVLDGFLRGGILTPGITEIAGESAAGKTQLCMQLCLSVQRSTENGGLAGGAVYICTEDVFPSKRLHQLIQNFQKKLDATECRQLKLGDNIFIEHLSEIDQLVHCIQYRIPLLLKQSQVKLIVVDSVAALFRCEFSPGEAAKRAKRLQSLGAQLHRLSRLHHVPVICVNQVTANMSSGSLNPNQRQLIPALGLAWSNLIQTRLMLGRTAYKLSSGDAVCPPRPEDATQTQAGTDEVPVRSMEVVFAPHLPNDTCYFVVEAAGVRGLR
ncbi:DNA repair protein XRCC3-like [Patiria miniata]|uniref:RecA family profile 1 domain-containing protein n=1 Tax=Patiria miniata TaxID=46514 RepID=A0A914BNI8_PATMI|nr:DNA repair protein XRCC3-like [Patiria miniata]